MKLLFCGDIVGRSGREAVLETVPKLRKERGLDAVVVNADNAASGFGVNKSICEDLFAAGTDVITGGDHIWDQKDIIGYIASEPRLLRPHNFPPRTPGSGVVKHRLPSGKVIMVIHILGQVFHNEYLDCPFAAVDAALDGVKLGVNVDAIIVDVHAEATSEKMAFGQFLDGRVSMVVGSHTHVPTADARIMPKGTAYQTDTGMCGDYNSVIGFDPEAPLTRFTQKMKRTRLAPAMGEATVCALYVETDDKTGLAVKQEMLHIGGALNK